MLRTVQTDTYIQLLVLSLKIISLGLSDNSLFQNKTLKWGPKFAGNIKPQFQPYITAYLYATYIKKSTHNIFKKCKIRQQVFSHNNQFVVVVLLKCYKLALKIMYILNHCIKKWNIYAAAHQIF